MEVPIGNSVVFNIIPDAGYAVDVITLDNISYVNDGVSDPPINSSWTQINISSVSSTTSLSVTFSQSSDDSGIADKYKLKVTASAGAGGTVNPKEQLVVSGEDAIIDITPDYHMAVDTIETPEVTYINNVE